MRNKKVKELKKVVRNIFDFPERKYTELKYKQKPVIFTGKSGQREVIMVEPTTVLLDNLCLRKQYKLQKKNYLAAARL